MNQYRAWQQTRIGPAISPHFNFDGVKNNKRSPRGLGKATYVRAQVAGEQGPMKASATIRDFDARYVLCSGTRLYRE